MIIKTVTALAKWGRQQDNSWTSSHPVENVRQCPPNTSINELGNNVKEKLEEAAVNGLKLPHGLPSQFIKRDILPRDLSLPAWHVPDLGPHLLAWVSLTVPENTWLSVYKVIQLSAYPRADTVGFQVNGVIVGLYSMAAAYKSLPIVERLQEALMDPEARRVFERLSGSPMCENLLGNEMAIYFQPLIFKPADRVRVLVSQTRENGKADELVLVGCIAEPNGQNIVR